MDVVCVYVCMLYTSDLKFGTTQNCFSMFIIKAVFSIDRKVQSGRPTNKHELFTYQLATISTNII